MGETPAPPVLFPPAAKREGRKPMATHEFGIMERTPLPGERYDDYEPEKYHVLAVEDDVIEPLLPALSEVDFFWHSLDMPGKGLDYAGITLIPPSSMEAVLRAIGETPALGRLRALLQKARAEGRFVIHYGL